MLLLVAACGTQETQAIGPEPVEKPPARKVAPEKLLEFIAVVSSKHTQVIAADFDGKVLELSMRNGQQVRQGAVVAKLDDSQLKSKLAEAKGQLQRAKGAAARAGTAYANAERRAKLEQRLIRSGAAAPEAFRSIRAEAGQYGADGSSAAGDISTSQATIAELEAQIAKANVVAPFDGTIAVVKVRQGEIASKGTPIARVFDPTQPVVRFAVPRKYASQIKLGMQVELVTNIDNRVVPATVRSQDDTADPSVDLTIFEADVDPNIRTGEIHVGENGHVRITGAVR